MVSNENIFTEDFFNTAYVVTDAKPVSELTYLTMVETPPANADSFAELSVIPRKRAVELETYSIEVENMNKEDLSPYIDVSPYSASVALNNLKQNTSKKLIGIYQTCGNETRENTLTKRQIFFRKIFKNLEFPVFVEHEFDTPESLRKIIAKLLLYSNLVAAKSRRGPANFIVVNGALGSLLQDNPSFVFTELNQTRTTMPTVPYAIGMLGGFKVFIDPYKRFDDFSFLVGRRTSRHDPGVYLIEGDMSINEIEQFWGGKQTVLKKRMALVKTDESANAAFYSNKFVFGKKPLWRKLFKL